jgi:hypothetical protein
MADPEFESSLTVSNRNFSQIARNSDAANRVSRAVGTVYKEFGLSPSHDSETVLFFQKYPESTDVITQTHV